MRGKNINLCVSTHLWLYGRVDSQGGMPVESSYEGMTPCSVSPSILFLWEAQVGKDHRA